MNVSVLLDGEESSLEFWDACMDQVKFYVPSPPPLFDYHFYFNEQRRFASYYIINELIFEMENNCYVKV